MKKAQKVALINKYFEKSKSSVVERKQPKAYLNEDGHIRYSILVDNRYGEPYRARSSYREVLLTLHGKDFQELHARINR